MTQTQLLHVHIEANDGTAYRLDFTSESLGRFTARSRGKDTAPAGERDPFVVPSGVKSVAITTHEGKAVELVHRVVRSKKDDPRLVWTTSQPVAQVDMESGQPVLPGETKVYLEISERPTPAATDRNPQGSPLVRFRLVRNQPRHPQAKRRQSQPYPSLDQVGTLL